MNIWMLLIAVYISNGDASGNGRWEYEVVYTNLTKKECLELKEKEDYRVQFRADAELTCQNHLI